LSRAFDSARLERPRAQHWLRYGVALAERFVLDASVALARFLQETDAATRYAASIAEVLARENAICVVPAIFHIEVAATLVRKRRDNTARFGKAKLEAALAQLTRLRLHTELSYYRVDGIVALANQYHVQGFDSIYLDLAARLKLPLATIDRGLRSAARRNKVALLDATARA
jgi:predicted nucleic acid-binding protein